MHLGAFVDDPADLAYVPELERMCASLKAIVPLRPALARLRSLPAVLDRRAADLAVLPRCATWRHGSSRSCRDHAIAKVRRVLVGDGAVRAGTSRAAAGRRFRRRGLREMGSIFRASRPWPLASLYAARVRRLLAFERAVARALDASVFVSQAEAISSAACARERAGGALRTERRRHGLTFHLTPTPAIRSRRTIEAFVFTGVMDYWPNIDAVTWFAKRGARPQNRRQEAERALLCGGRITVRAVRGGAGGTSIR